MIIDITVFISLVEDELNYLYVLKTRFPVYRM